MTKYHLAQLNLAKMRAPLDSTVMADFVANLERINALAEQSPGFIWRLQTDEGDATSLRPFGDNYIVNVSLWTDVESLQNFVFKSDHIEIMRRRKEWFDKLDKANAALWWHPAGQVPTEDDAKAKLAVLRANGPSPEVFTAKRHFPPPGA